MRKIAAEFEKDTGHKALLVFGATGKALRADQKRCAVPGLFAADDKTPAKLEAEGGTVPGSRFTYAIGTLVLWSAIPGFVDDQGSVLEKGRLQASGDCKSQDRALWGGGGGHADPN
ncbi:MAG: substrate-binding domain-containing protein [Candidatus Competibacteraceae bacterium]